MVGLCVGVLGGVLVDLLHSVLGFFERFSAMFYSGGETVWSSSYRWRQHSRLIERITYLLPLRVFTGTA